MCQNCDWYARKGKWLRIACHERHMLAFLKKHMKIFRLQIAIRFPSSASIMKREPLPSDCLSAMERLSMNHAPRISAVSAAKNNSTLSITIPSCIHCYLVLRNTSDPRARCNYSFGTPISKKREKARYRLYQNRFNDQSFIRQISSLTFRKKWTRSPNFKQMFVTFWLNMKWFKADGFSTKIQSNLTRFSRNRNSRTFFNHWIK